MQTAAGLRETEIGLAWPLWLPGQRAASGAAADAELGLAAVAQRTVRWRVAGEVREAAWTLIAYQAEAAQADAQRRSLQALSDDVERRVRAGDLARADALATAAEVLAAAARLVEVRQRLLVAREHWTVLTGLHAMPDAVAESAEAVAVAQAVEHPELQLAAQVLERDRKRLAVVRASARDAPELFLAYRHEVSGRSEPTSNSIGIGLRLSFGTDDRNQPLLAAALSELDVAQASEQRLRERLAAEAVAARAALHSAQQQLVAERSRAELLHERTRLIDKSFRAGETELPELLRALSAAAQAESGAVRQQAALGLARARLHQSLGLLP